VAGRDITEGRGSPTAGTSFAIAVDLGITSSSHLSGQTQMYHLM
jgi:hypothetical protein